MVHPCLFVYEGTQIKIFFSVEAGLKKKKKDKLKSENVYFHIVLRPLTSSRFKRGGSYSGSIDSDFVKSRKQRRKTGT